MMVNVIQCIPHNFIAEQGANYSQRRNYGVTQYGNENAPTRFQDICTDN